MDHDVVTDCQVATETKCTEDFAGISLMIDGAPASPSG